MAERYLTIPEVAERLVTTERFPRRLITYLTAYLDTCGRTSGKPPAGPDLERFLPWTATPDDLNAWAQPPRPG